MWRSLVQVAFSPASRSLPALTGARRCLSSRSQAQTDHDHLPVQLLEAALAFIPTHGFSSAALLAGAAHHPELRQVSINRQTLSGLFPSTTIKSTTTPWQGSSTHEPIGPAKALAECWIQNGNRRMKSQVESENLTLAKDGLGGVERAFMIRLAYNRSIPSDYLQEALALVVTPCDPSFGVPLPIEMPHVLPYGSHALSVSTEALAGLKDYSRSREWMLRRIRLAGVYSAAELISIRHGESDASTLSEVRRLLQASESLAATVGEVFQFATYVIRSQRAIMRSFGLL